MIALVIHVEDTEVGQVTRHAFRRSPVRVGRGEGNELQLDRPFVSTRHGVVEFDAAGARYVDLGSTNGSSLGGVPLVRNALVEVPPGGEIAIGSYRIRLERHRTDEPRDGGARSTAFERNSAPVPPLEASARAEAAVAAEALRVAEERIRPAGDALDARHAAYQGARQALRAAVEQVLAPLEGLARRRALERLAERYPAVQGEPPLVPLPGADGRPAAPDGATPGPPAEALRLLRVLGESYLPEGRVPHGPEGLARLLGRVSAVLEAAARSYVALRGPPPEPPATAAGTPPGGDGGLDRASTPEQVIAWLLDADGQGRAEELERALARLAGGAPAGGE